jgi:hypothetical protein
MVYTNKNLETQCIASYRDWGYDPEVVSDQKSLIEIRMCKERKIRKYHDLFLLVI